MSNVFFDPSRVGTRHAILFSGTGDPWTLNDLEFCWRMLTGPYQFDPNDIQVLYFSNQLETNDLRHPATFFPSATPNDPYRIRIDKEGTAGEFHNACAVLAERLQQDDLLFIYTNGHGSVNTAGQAYLMTFDDDEFTPDMFSTELEQLPQHASLLIMLQQCYGAAFMNPVVKAKEGNRLHVERVSCACASNGVSYANDIQSFSRFSWGWVAAHLDMDNFDQPLAEEVAKDSTGFIEASEAYRYARKIAVPKDDPKKDNPSTRNRPEDAKEIRLA